MAESDEQAPELPANMKVLDRVIRALLGVALIVLSFTHWVAAPYDSWIRVAAILPFATALLGWCPAYQIAAFFRNRGDATPASEGSVRGVVRVQAK